MHALCKIMPTWWILWKALCMADDGLVITPDPKNFGTSYLNQSVSATITFTNTNDHKNITQIQSIASMPSLPFSYLGGAFPGTGGTCSSSSTLGPGQTCTVVLQFTPTTVGSASSNLGIAYKLQNSDKKISSSLSGTGALSPAALSILDGSSYGFLARPIGLTARKTVTLKNTGQQTATTLSIALSTVGVYSLESGTCNNGGTLAGGASCTTVVAFAPSNSSSQISTLSISASGISPSTISFSGSGESPLTIGSSDTNYGIGTTGVATTNIGGTTEIVTALQPLGDDTLVGGGFTYTGNSNDFAIARYKVNGSLDTDFNTTGTRIIDFNGAQDVVSAVSIDSSGNAALIGFSGTDFAFAKVATNGQLDTTFNGTGTKILDLNSGSNDFCYAGTVNTTGKIVAVGNSSKDGAMALAVVRIGTDGNLDTTFNSTGKILTTFGTANTSAHAVAIQSDGKILVGGTSRGTNDYDLFVARYDSNGRLDASFNTTGYTFIDLGSSNDKVTDIYLDTTGSIFLSGRLAAASNDETVGVVAAKLRTDGTFDTTFANRGKFKPPAVTGTEVQSSIRKLSNGDILIAWFPSPKAGSTNIRITKLDLNGAVVNSYGTNGTYTSQIVATKGQKPALAVQNDGRVLVGGTVINAGVGDFAVERQW